MYELDQLTGEGDARSMGLQQGEALRDRVQSILSHRLAEMTGYLTARSIDRMHRVDEPLERLRLRVANHVVHDYIRVRHLNSEGGLLRALLGGS